MKRKIFKIVLILLILSAMWAWWWFLYSKYYKPKNSNNEVQKDSYYDVVTWNMISSIKVLGETNLLNEQKLKFNINWTVKWVYVSEGKKVKTWDLLAELDKWELENDLKEANINYENAKNNLDKLQDKLITEDMTKDKTSLESQERKIKLSENDLEKAITDNKIKINDKTKELEESLVQLQKNNTNSKVDIEKINTDLVDLKKDLEYKKKTLSDERWKINKSIQDEDKNLNTKINDHNKEINNTYSQIDNDIASFEDSLRNLNNTLGIDKDYKTVVDNLYFSAKNSLFKSQAQSYYWNAKWWLSRLEQKVATLKDKTKNITDLESLLLIEKEIYDNLYYAWDYTSKWADFSVETLDYTASEITSAKSTGSSIRTSSYSSKNQIDDTIKKLKDLESLDILKEKSRIEVQKLSKDLENLDTTLEKLERDYNNLKLTSPDKIVDINVSNEKLLRSYTNSKKDLEDLEYTLNIAEEDKKIEIKNLKQEYEIATKNFNKKYATIENNEELKIAKNTLKQAQIAIDQVNKKIENYEIKAPFDWVIDSFDLKKWDNLSSNSTEEKYIQLINPGLLEIKIKLDQIDIVRVNKWQLANVTFDSYPEKIFTGTLSTIDSKPIDDNWVKKYQVRMIIDKWDLNIFSWMSANVDIVFEEKENVVIVPTMAIESDSNTSKNYVTVLENGKKLKKDIEIWLNNEWMTEVTSWLKVWDKVLEINFDANSFKQEDFSSPTPFYWP